MFGTVPDLLRLLVVPALGWAAWRDSKIRRVPNVVWYPIAALGLLLLAWEGLGHLPATRVTDRLYLVRAGISVGLVVPLSYLFWRLGGFGGADAKALMALALVFPTFPDYTVGALSLPVVRPTLGVFSMTILTNTVLLGATYPLVLAARNAVAGEVGLVMFVGRRVGVSDLATAHGRLFESPDGLTRSGLDLDALRMYLRWRGTTLEALRDAPAAHRDPDSIGRTHDPTDGAVVADGGQVRAATAATDSAVDDPWGAAAFLDAIDGTAYGTTPENLRDGLEVVTTNDEVWISPGIPFIVPMFVGLVAGLLYGDLLFGLLGAAGLA